MRRHQQIHIHTTPDNHHLIHPCCISVDCISQLATTRSQITSVTLINYSPCTIIALPSNQPSITPTLLL
ncbi:hypothetical protein DCAR_0728072 [Daucus carota subsp. sativus]|uniref:Uncharacterized protein n=1 Tax=Daucus carota subsp. sativus TaxID=79200 RepID=A0A164T7B7_DAUCS|nr:hypothetical protein DCAR_0728072 [Daucus carota subsp. sativus]